LSNSSALTKLASAPIKIDASLTFTLFPPRPVPVCQCCQR
jgi:hypothetical protein